MNGSAGPAPTDPLATRQQIVRDRMTQLEDRMFRLADKLAESEPEQAERLRRALRQARELLIRRNMEETITLLDEGDLIDAADRQLVIMKNLEQVLEILLEDPDNTAERKKEIDRLKEFHKKIQELLDAQQALKAKTDAPAKLLEEVTQPLETLAQGVAHAALKEVAQGVLEVPEVHQVVGERLQDVVGVERWDLLCPVPLVVAIGLHPSPCSGRDPPRGLCSGAC